MGLRSFLNIERQFSFYGAYHANPVNVAIHITCVPMIMFTAFQFNTLSWAQLPHTFSYPFESALPFDLCTVAATLYCALYILMEPVAGTLLSAIVMSFAYYAHQLTATLGPGPATRLCLAIHVAAWIAQFVGHGKFEGRAPALLDNLVQALFLAPIFVWMEVLFRLGYRPGLRGRVDRVIAKEISGFRRERLERARVEVERKNKELRRRE